MCAQPSRNRTPPITAKKTSAANKPAFCSANSVGGNAAQDVNAEDLKAVWEQARRIEGFPEFTDCVAGTIEGISNSVDNALHNADGIKIALASTPWIDKAIAGKPITAKDVKDECKGMTKKERAIINQSSVQASPSMLH